MPGVYYIMPTSPDGSSKSFRDLMRFSGYAEALMGIFPKQVSSLGKIVPPSGATPTVASSSANLEVVSYVPPLATSLISTTAFTAKTAVTGYAFFTSVADKNAILREKITTGSLFLLNAALLGLESYYLFSNIDCATEDSSVCKVGFYLNAITIGLTLLAAGGSELFKRSFSEEEAIKQEKAEKKALKRNRPSSPFEHARQQNMVAPIIPGFIIDHDGPSGPVRNFSACNIEEGGPRF